MSGTLVAGSTSHRVHCSPEPAPQSRLRRQLISHSSGLEPLDEQEAKDCGAIEDFDAEGEPEVRVPTLQPNPLGVEPAVFNLLNDLKDGLAILQALDKNFPGTVVWRRVAKLKEGGVRPYVEPLEGDDGEDIGVTPSQSTLSRFKRVEDCNYSIELGKQSGMHLVGIRGADIVDGSKTLVLGLVASIE